MANIVFDIGGTNFRVARAENGTLAEIERASTPRDPVQAVALLGELADRLLCSGKPAKVAGGIIGIVGHDHGGTLSAPPHFPEWGGFAFRTRFAERLGVPVRLYNDNALAALAEARQGAGSGAKIVAQLRIGTGVGGARIVNGDIDACALGFEPGHQIINAMNAETLESRIGGDVITRKSKMAPVNLGRKMYDDLTPDLATGIWNSILHWSPDVFVLTGPLMDDVNGFRLADVVRALENIRRTVRILPELPDIRLGMLGDDAGLMGAALLL